MVERGDPNIGFSVSDRLNDHIQSMWKDVFSAQRPGNPRAGGMVLSETTQLKLFALTEFNAALFNNEMVSVREIGETFDDLFGRVLGPCEAQMVNAMGLLCLIYECLFKTDEGRALLRGIRLKLIDVKVSLYHGLTWATLNRVEQFIEVLRDHPLLIDVSLMRDHPLLIDGILIDRGLSRLRPEPEVD